MPLIYFRKLKSYNRKERKETSAKFAKKSN